MTYQETMARIQRAIKDKFKTQKEFAIASGITETSVSRHMHGVRKLSLDKFIKICEATGKSPNELIGWDKPLFVHCDRSEMPNE